jgi:starch phosphorylase
VAKWQQLLKKKWGNMRFGEVEIKTSGDQYIFEMQVYFNGLDLHAARRELYAERVRGSAPVEQKTTRSQQLEGTKNGYIYKARVSVNRPGTDYTARAMPYYQGAVVPLEAGQILWQR